MKRGGLFQSKSAKCYPQFAGHCQWAKGEIVQPFSTMEMPSGTVHSREITFPDNYDLMGFQNWQGGSCSGQTAKCGIRLSRASWPKGPDEDDDEVFYTLESNQTTKLELYIMLEVSQFKWQNHWAVYQLIDIVFFTVPDQLKGGK